MQKVVGAGIIGAAVTNDKRLAIARPPCNPKVIRMWYEAFDVCVQSLLARIEILGSGFFLAVHDT